MDADGDSEDDDNTSEDSIDEEIRFWTPAAPHAHFRAGQPAVSRVACPDARVRAVGSPPGSVALPDYLRTAIQRAHRSGENAVPLHTVQKPTLFLYPCSLSHFQKKKNNKSEEEETGHQWR